MCIYIYIYMYINMYLSLSLYIYIYIYILYTHMLYTSAECCMLQNVCSLTELLSVSM